MTTAAFERCHSVTKGWEGGWVNDPDDRGGATNFGVTQGTYDGWRDSQNLPRQSVRNLTVGEATKIYFENYWLKPGCNTLFTGVDLAVYDFGVNSGPSRARKFMVANLDDQNRHDVTVKNICQARLSFVRGLSTFWKFGRGWSNRIADVQAKGVAWAVTAMSSATEAREQLEREAGQKRKEEVTATGGGAATGTGSAGGAVGVDVAQADAWMLYALVCLGIAFTLYFVWRAFIKRDQKKAYQREADLLAKTIP